MVNGDSSIAKSVALFFFFYLFPRVLAIYTNHLGRNLVHKTIKFDSVGKRPAALYIQIS